MINPYCSFCHELKTKRLTIHWISKKQTICWESKYFSVVPSVGSFVEGYFLLLPKTHLISFASLTTELYDEYRQIIKTVLTQLEQVWWPYIMFEHWSTLYDIWWSCCQHAHMHLVPYCGKPSLAHCLQWKTIVWIKELPKHYSYIYLFERWQHRVKKYDHTTMWSQYLRKLIARKNNYWWEERNWRKYPFEHKIRESLRIIKKRPITTTNQLLP